MEAICKVDFDKREKAQKTAEKLLEDAKKTGKPTDRIVIPHNTFYDIYGVWFFSQLTNIIRQVATEQFNVELGRMMHVYLDVEAEKVADGIHEIIVYGHQCLLYKWMAQGYHRGLIVLSDDEPGNIAAKIYRDSGTWSWMLDDETTERLPVRV